MIEEAAAGERKPKYTTHFIWAFFFFATNYYNILLFSDMSKNIINHHPSDSSAIDDKEKQLESLTVVSMNIASCEPSKSAPAHWTREKSIDALRDNVLRSDPTIIALQECPGGAKFAAKIFPTYQVIGSTYSHADQVILLVKYGINATQVFTSSSPVFHSLMKKAPAPVESKRLPAVIAELEWDNRHLLVASVHLEPFAEGAHKRQMQMQSLVQLSKSMSMPLFIIGDMNMRDNEDETMENELNLLDVWKLAGSCPATQWTWDTIDHRRGNAGGFFNQYYGEHTRQYQARYDRVYVHENDMIDLAIPPTFELIANQPLTSYKDFLSDHFGVTSHFQLTWNVR